MQVLMCGATGFIGRHLARRLLDAGHTVVAVMRHPARAQAGGLPRGLASRVVAGDFSTDVSPAAWRSRLVGIDVVVNAVGILREQGSQTFDALHVRGPKALFEACVEADVPRVVQVSALGADTQARSKYHLSKLAADEHLLSLPLAATVVQPSLVYGPGGASAELFKCWASLPVIPVPLGGLQAVQPVHIDDLVEAVLRLVEQAASPPRRVAIVGPAPLALRDYLAQLRTGLQLPKAPVVGIPRTLVEAGVAAGSLLPGALFDQETFEMLQRGNTAPADDMQRLLGRPPRSADDFVAPETADMERTQARLAWTLPMLRVSVALVWIVTGLLSFGLYPVEDSYALLARLGITGPWASLALYGAAGLDLALGVGTLLLRRRILLWWTQIALMLGYMALITWALPEFWLHPFGPILKNLPMLAAVGLLLALEKRTWNT
jgi:uncharacterized protein YbjT (DUF2867 family)